MKMCLKVVAVAIMYPPVVCSTPLGLPVEPDVYCSSTTCRRQPQARLAINGAVMPAV